MQNFRDSPIIPLRCSSCNQYHYFLQMQSHKVTTLQTLLLVVALEVQLISASPNNNQWSWSLFSNRQARAIENLHSGEHCVDVSTYEPVAFKDVTVEVCDSTFEKNCEQKNEQVRIRVSGWDDSQKGL